MKNKSVRVDYQLKRNKEIYSKYISGKSLNELGDEYVLSPQRVSRIIKELKENNLHKKLNLESSKADRESYLKKAINLREQGNLDISILMFDQVIAWDQKNDNKIGLIHTLGHKKIALQKQAEFSKSTKQKQDLLKQASTTAKEALNLAKQTKDKGLVAICSVHYASVLLSLSLSKKIRNEGELKEALKVLNPVLKNFPGSAAHKAWPLKLKAEILIELEKPMEAFLVLSEAELCLLQGYKEENKEVDRGSKLNVWLTGIWLAKSKVCIKLNYPILAKSYAESVLGVKDKQNILALRKKEAKGLLKSLG